MSIPGLASGAGRRASPTRRRCLSTCAATPAGYRVAAADTYVILSRRFATEDISRWREPRRMYDVSGQGAGKPPELPFFDRGTSEQLLELAPSG